MSTAEYIAGHIAIVIILSLFFFLAVALHMAYTKIDLIVEHLKNCTAIMARAPLKHGEPWGRLLLIGGISGILTFPNFYLKRGELCPEDLKKFSALLKRKLVVMQWAILILVVGMFLLALIGKSGLLK